MDTASITLARLKRILIRIVVVALVVAYAAPTWFEGESRRIAMQTLIFAHLFLPVWAWVYYAHVRRKLGENPRPRLCGKCGYNMNGMPRKQCPECGETPRRGT